RFDLGRRHGPRPRPGVLHPRALSTTLETDLDACPRRPCERRRGAMPSRSAEPADPSRTRVDLDASEAAPERASADPDATTHDLPFRIPRGWLVALLLATGGVFAGWFGPIQILLPAQAQHFAGLDKEALLALVTGIGAVASLIANPLWGLLADRMSLTRP